MFISQKNRTGLSYYPDQRSQIMYGKRRSKKQRERSRYMERGEGTKELANIL